MVCPAAVHLVLCADRQAQLGVTAVSLVQGWIDRIQNVFLVSVCLQIITADLMLAPQPAHYFP